MPIRAVWHAGFAFQAATTAPDEFDQQIAMLDILLTT
jgi:hypothetical protein